MNDVRIFYLFTSCVCVCFMSTLVLDQSETLILFLNSFIPEAFTHGVGSIVSLDDPHVSLNVAC